MTCLLRPERASARRRSRESEMIRVDSITTMLDLVAYARKHRYRLRNLQDGGPVPPALPTAEGKDKPGYRGAEDRWDAIVGRNGYTAIDGDRLSVFHKSTKGVNRGLAKLEALEARIEQVGDTEIGATVDPNRIEEVLTLIRISKVPLRNPGGNPGSLKAPVSEAVREPESANVGRMEH